MQSVQDCLFNILWLAPAYQVLIGLEGAVYGLSSHFRHLNKRVAMPASGLGLMSPLYCTRHWAWMEGRKIGIGPEWAFTGMDSDSMKLFQPDTQ